MKEKRTKVVVMTLAKDTKGTHVYAEPNVPGKFFPVVYVQKNQLPDPPPKEIRVTVEWDLA
jgi:hypothetical protein